MNTECHSTLVVDCPPAGSPPTNDIEHWSGGPMEWKILQDAFVSALAAATPLSPASPVEVPPPEDYDSAATMPLIAHSPPHSTTDDDACETPDSEATTVVSSDWESPGLGCRCSCGCVSPDRSTRNMCVACAESQDCRMKNNRVGCDLGPWL